MTLSHPNFIRCALRAGVFLSVLSTVMGYHDSPDDVLAVFYDSSRQFTSTPDVGITLVSSAGPFESFLVNGETDETVLTFTFLPPAGATLNQYTIEFVCDSGVVVSTDSCMVNNVEVPITGSDSTAFNTTVTCAFNQFPGSTSCQLLATPTVVVRQGMSMPNEILSNRQPLPSFESQAIQNDVFGIVFYIPDASGALSENSTIVSGDDNSYTLNAFDRTNAGVRELSIAGTFPGGTAVAGSPAISFFTAAAVSTTVGDQILRYNVGSCTLVGADIIDNAVRLRNPTSCGIGIAAPDDESPPRIGLQFRTYKSGGLSVRLRWSSFGTSTEEYEQVLNLNITEPAPPVITGVTGRSERYRSVPCEVETLTLTGFNLRFADTRQLVVQNSDATTSIWSQQVGGFTYNAPFDISSLTFESAGGLGTDVPFTIKGIFGTEERTSIVLDPSLSLTLSFTAPPVLNAINPPRTRESGGETIVLSGSFDGFGETDNSYVFVGGFPINANDVVLDGTGTISFTSPALTDLGQEFNYPVTISICAETSGSQTLIYAVPPSLTLTVIDSSPDETGHHVVPPGGSLSFIAEVSGNNQGLQYIWNVFDSAGQDITASDRTSNAQIFTIGTNELPSASETYTVKVEVRNSLDLRDSKQVRIREASSTTEIVIVKIYPVEELHRSSEVLTLVQATVTILTASGAVVALQDSDLILEWTYRGERFKVDTTADQGSVNSAVTGPTQLGLEFNIAQADLQIGTQELSLEAYLSSNRDVGATDTVLLTVVSSPLQAFLNDGINGSLVLSSSDLALSADKSSDPDILSGEGDNRAGIVYEWTSCRKSLLSSFRSGVENCSSILPADRGVSSFIVASSDLQRETIDNSSDPDPTYISFGLRVRKDRRSAEVYLYFEVQTLPAQKVPRLDSLELVDLRGNVLDRTSVDTHSEIIIRPSAVSDPLASWTFEMVNLNQRFLFSTTGVLRTGPGFVSSARQQSRLLLGFSRNSLKPSTQYVVRITVSASDASINSDYELSFTTADVPKLTCTAPEVTTGTTSETQFTITAQLSFETQGIEYCFYLVGSPTKRFAVGKGCSSVPFATFTFPAAGSYGIECHAKTASGGLIEVVSLGTSLVLATPTPAPGLSTIEILKLRLQGLDNEVTQCQAARDHKCIERLIAVAVDITVEISQAVSSDSSPEAVALKEAAGEYLVRLSGISERLAERTVFRPNQVENSIDQTLSLVEVPSDLFVVDSTIFNVLKPTQIAVNFASTESAQPIISIEIIQKISAVANLTLSVSYSLSQGGSSRSRLLKQNEVTRSAYAVTVQELPQYIAQMRVQQELCGYVGRESTSYPDSFDGAGRPTTGSDGTTIAPIDINVGIMCNAAQASEAMVGDVTTLKVCTEAFSQPNRLEIMLAEVPKKSIIDTGFVTEVENYADVFPYILMKGDNESLPEQCLELRTRWNSSSFDSTPFDQIVAGRLVNPISLEQPTCSPTTCYNLALDEKDAVDFTSEENVIIMRTSNEGLFVAGNLTRIAAPVPDGNPIDENDSISGVGGRSGGAIARVLGIVAAFAVVATVATWLTVTNFCVVSSVDEPVATNWEYLERDMFGRGLDKDGTGRLIRISDIMPEGARPPLEGIAAQQP